MHVAMLEFEVGVIWVPLNSQDGISTLVGIQGWNFRIKTYRWNRANQEVKVVNFLVYVIATVYVSLRSIFLDVAYLVFI